MEMSSIRYFLAVAETMNFTRAAENCGITQPTLTRAIARLEEELGGELLSRERNQTHLTELGRLMLPCLKQCHDSAMDAEVLALENLKGPRTVLTLALSHTIPMTLISGQIKGLMQAFPQLEFEYVRGTNAQIIEALANGKAELAIAGPLGKHRERLDNWTLFDEDFALAISESNIHSDLEPVELSRLRDMTLLARPYCEKHADLADLLERAGIAIRKAQNVSRDADLVPLIRADLGASIIPRSIGTGYGFRMIAIADFQLKRTVNLYSVVGRERTAAAGTLTGLLLSYDWESGTSGHGSGSGVVGGRPVREAPHPWMSA